MQIEQWTLFGQSFGGLVAASYAQQHPHRVDKIIFTSSTGLNLDFQSEFEVQMKKQLTPSQIDCLEQYNSKLNNGDTSIETLQAFSELLALAYVYNKENSAPIAKRLQMVDYSVYAIIMEDLKKTQFDLTTSFMNFHKPVLVLQGLNDVISEQTAKKIAKAFPQSQLVLFEKCGHYPWIDAPEQFWSQIEQFLQ